MKRAMALVLSVLVMACGVGDVLAVTTLSSSASVTLATALSIEFAAATDTSFTTTVPWTSIDPASEALPIRPTGFSTTKPDVGLICKYNGSSANWYLKMNMTATTLTGKIQRYISQPTNRNTSTATNGVVAGGTTSWVDIPATAATVYTSNNDTVNTPFGTFVGVNLGLNPTGLVAGTAHSATITYTISTAP